MFITRITKILFVCIISLVLFTTSLANAGPVVTSREYKLILIPSNFNGSNPDNAVNDYWSELKLLIEGEPINIEKIRQIKNIIQKRLLVEPKKSLQQCR